MYMHTERAFSAVRAVPQTTVMWVRRRGKAGLHNQTRKQQAQIHAHHYTQHAHLCVRIINVRDRARCRCIESLHI